MGRVASAGMTSIKSIKASLVIRSLNTGLTTIISTEKTDFYSLMNMRVNRKMCLNKWSKIGAYIFT